MGALLKRAVEISERFAGAAEAVALSQGLGYPVSWAHGVSKLRSMERPLDWPVKQWPVLVVDASIFCKRWAAQSHRLGWEDWELFGCHRRAPWGAIHAMGLVPMLKGDGDRRIHDGRSRDQNCLWRAAELPAPAARPATSERARAALGAGLGP